MVTGISEHLSPTYMQRTAGELKEENFNYKTHDYFVIYNAKPKGKSLLYFHEKLNYPKGYEVQLNPKELIPATRNLSERGQAINWVGTLIGNSSQGMWGLG